MGGRCTDGRTGEDIVTLQVVLLISSVQLINISALLFVCVKFVLVMKLIPFVHIVALENVEKDIEIYIF